VVEELEKLLAYLNTKEGRRFELVGASILIVAESDREIQESGSAPLPKVKIIDFAHSHIIGPKGVVLDNGILYTSYRKKVYQKGLTRGLEHIIKDLRDELNLSRL